MRTLILTLAISGFIISHLCGQGNTKSQLNLTGKVYTSEYYLDRINCVTTYAKDNYFTYIFLNDSTFIQIVNNCCPIDTIDFASELYFIGKYKIVNNVLILRYRPNGLTIYSKQSLNTKKNDSPIISSHIVIEKVDLTQYELEIKNCKNISYLKNIETDDYISYVSVTGHETIQNIKSRLKMKGIWEKLLNL